MYADPYNIIVSILKEASYLNDSELDRCLSYLDSIDVEKAKSDLIRDEYVKTLENTDNHNHQLGLANSYLEDTVNTLLIQVEKLIVELGLEKDKNTKLSDSLDYRTDLLFKQPKSPAYLY